MSERARRRRNRRNALKATAACGLVGVTLGGIALANRNPEVVDGGSDVVGKCEPGYIEATDQKRIVSIPAETPGAGNTLFKAGISQLAEIVPISVGGAHELQFSNQEDLTNNELHIQHAAGEVFYVNDDQQFDIGNPYDPNENRLDDLSEEFCVSEGELYLTPQAQEAVAAMNAVGVKVFNKADYGN